MNMTSSAIRQSERSNRKEHRAAGMRLGQGSNQVAYTLRRRARIAAEDGSTGAH